MVQGVGFGWGLNDFCVASLLIGAATTPCRSDGVLPNRANSTIRRMDAAERRWDSLPP